ncbi:hypothetical protein G4D82_04900 [Flavobacterium sp. CYK-4]|uniref:hypothetical protein n=1 Tax=Flavobacterium lotistagni TaxID=2709660 RepID=UPI001409CCD9|nr:hypothetical protein [Flavobacterium lotistagni]NHM06550.1 hypothetical protein [Flavobacterium lotistagni]
MVTIVDFKTFERENGENFFGLVVQGGVEVVKSQETGRNYLTARTATIPTTFNQITCESLIGSTLEGKIKKVECETYEYTPKDSDDVIQLSHRYEFVTEEAEILENNVVNKDFVA